MGNAAVYYYPEADGAQVALDLGEPLSNLVMVPVRKQSSAETWDGEVYTVLGYGRHRVTVTLSNFTSAALARQLHTLSPFLLAGGRVGIAEDAAKAWAGYVTTDRLRRGATTISTWGNPFYNQAASLAAGDEIVIQSCGPGSTFELTTVSTFTGGRNLTIADALRYDYSGAPILIRHRGFWPILRVPVDARNQVPVTDNYRITHTWQVTLEEDLSTSARMAFLRSTPLRGTTYSQGKLSIGNLVDKFAGVLTARNLQSKP